MTSQFMHLTLDPSRLRSAGNRSTVVDSRVQVIEARDAHRAHLADWADSPWSEIGTMHPRAFGTGLGEAFGSLVLVEAGFEVTSTFRTLKGGRRQATVAADRGLGAAGQAEIKCSRDINGRFAFTNMSHGKADWFLNIGFSRTAVHAWLYPTAVLHEFGRMHANVEGSVPGLSGKPQSLTLKVDSADAPAWLEGYRLPTRRMTTMFKSIIGS